MPLIPPETIEQINAANDIVEVVGGYIPLKRAGAVWKALCPFHQERTPSFTVNPQRQIFKCFGCGAGGGPIRFVQSYENLDFVSAVRKLADRAGIRIVEAEMSAEDQARYGMRRRLLALHAEAAEFFHAQLLKKPSAQVARDYLKSRGIDGEIAKAWKLGYAPDAWDAMRDFARANGFSDEELLVSGLVKPRDEERADGEFYDRFRARVMFPICNDSGEVMAFSGRTLEADAKAAKYVNSPETILFKKGEILFGLHKSKRALIDSNSAIVCEGQIDLITAFEAGIKNVIAPQGTAFTEHQARILKRFVEEVTLCFDADLAGEKAAERSFEILLRAALRIRIITMPEGEDPDSLIRSRGADAFREVVSTGRDFFAYQLTKLRGRENLSTPQGKARAAERIGRYVELLGDGFLKEAVVGSVAKELELNEQEFLRILNSRALKQSSGEGISTGQQTTAAIKRGIEQRVIADRGTTARIDEAVIPDPTIRLLALVALHDGPARAWLLAEPWRRMVGADPNAGLLAKILDAKFTPGDAASTNVFLTTLDAVEEACISGLLEDKPPEHAVTIVHDCWRELERREIRRKIDSLQARLRAPELAAAEQTKLLKEVLDHQKRLQDIARPLSPPL